MELLDGMDLDALVHRFGPVPPERAIHLLRQVCHSLAEAESKGLVHRDIKPSNIFACRYGGDHDFVKVLDFGIVKATDTSLIETGVQATSTMMLQGTPAFIAPEQALGGVSIDGRADIYATGCVAYWLLTGQLVFTADTVMGTIMHHARTAPVPPSERSELPIPPDLDALVLACLAKDPAERPQSARELSRRLANASGGSTWSDEQAREWWSAHYPARRRQSNAPPSGLQAAGSPGTGDREGDPRALFVHEQPFAVGAVAGAGKLGAGEVAPDPVALAVQHRRVPAELEDLAIQREAVQEFVAAAVLAEHQTAAGADGDVVGRVQHGRARRLEQHA